MIKQDLVITNKIVTEYIHEFYRPLSKTLEDLRAYGEEHEVPIILKETENFLNFLLALKKPVKILEIGTAIGYSAIYYASCCPSAEIYTVEKMDNMFEIATENVEKAGLSDRIHIYHGDGEECIDQIREEGTSGFDFVFIDAAKSHYKRFLDAALKICSEGAVIVSDNVLQKGITACEIHDVYRRNRTRTKYMKQYLEYITGDDRFETSLLSAGDGLALTIYRGEHE